MQKFEVKLVGDVKYKTGLPDIEAKKVPGFIVNIEANTDQFPDLGEFINSLDGNVKRISLKSKDGNLKLNFDAIVGDCSITKRVEFAGEDEIRVVKIPLTISRRYIEDRIIELLDIFGEGDAVVTLSPVQLSMELKEADKGAPSDEELAAKKTPAPAADQPARAAAGRRPRGFDRSLN